LFKVQNGGIICLLVKWLGDGSICRENWFTEAVQLPDHETAREDRA